MCPATGRTEFARRSENAYVVQPFRAVGGAMVEGSSPLVFEGHQRPWAWWKPKPLKRDVTNAERLLVALSSRRSSRSRAAGSPALRERTDRGRPAQRRAVSRAVPAPQKSAKTYGTPPGGTMRRRTDISSGSRTQQYSGIAKPISWRSGQFKGDERPTPREIEWEGKCAISTGRCSVLRKDPSR
jgi:hypothetical protein